MVEIRKARPDELEEICALVRRAVVRMNALGNPQWGQDYPTQDHYRADAERGELYAALSGPRIAGVACINTRQAPEYAGVPWTTASPAVVIHRMAVDPCMQRQGVGRSLFRFAEALALRQGVQAMRIDTYSLNAGMQALILSQGFVRAGEVHLRRELPYPCFEKQIAQQVS